jgi:branched-chain amino acid transport system substrate-binding protein
VVTTVSGLRFTLGSHSSLSLRTGDFQADSINSYKEGIIMRSHWSALAAALVILVIIELSGASWASGATERGVPYKIGWIISITGPMAPMGIANRDAVLLALDKINKAGGVNGHPLELIIYDDESDPSKGVMAIKKLIEVDKVLVIGGTQSTGVAIPCAVIAEEAEVPMFPVNSSSWSVVMKPWNIPEPPTHIRRWVFKLGMDSEHLFSYIYDIWRQLGIKKVAWINAGNAMGRAFKAWAEVTDKREGFQVVIWEEYGPADTDMTAQLTRIKATDFELLHIGGAELAGGLVYKQAREMGIKVPITGTPPLAMRGVVDPLGKKIEGLILAAFKVDVGEALPLNDPQRAAVMELTKLITAKTGKAPDTAHACGWDLIMILADSLRRTSPDPSNLKQARAKVRDALETLKGFVGAQAMGDMLPRHEIPVPEVICVIKDGKAVPTKLK